MMIRNCRSMLAALVILVHAPIALAQVEEARRITVKVELLDFEGKPASELEVRARVARDAEFIEDVSLPRSDGSRVMTAWVPRSCEELEFVLGPPRRHLQWDRESQQTREAFPNLLRRNSFRSVYPLELAEDQSAYLLTIQAEEAVTVSCVLLNADGERVSGQLVSPGWLTDRIPRYDRSGITELLGIPKGRPVEIVVWSSSEQVKLLELSAEQTAEDLDLGEVTLDPIAGSAAVRLIDCNPGKHVGRSFTPDYTLISEDGQAILGVVILDHSGRPGNVTFRTSERWLAPGKYYLAPRSLADSEDARQLLRVIRAGKAMDHPELFSFLAIADRDIEIAFDSEEVVRGIREAAQGEFGDEGRRAP